MNNIANNFSSIEQITSQYLNQNKITTSKSSIENVSFEEILQLTKEKTLRFSKHAGERLVSRDINLTDEQYKRLEDGAKKAGEKGIKESLVLLDEYAFIVNTKSNTVITAMNQNYEEENIYTNIDGAVVI